MPRPEHLCLLFFPSLLKLSELQAEIKPRYF
jgi:hypothetical protein